MITVSAAAKDYLDRLMAEEKRDENTFVRVGVKGGGCSGLEYNLHLMWNAKQATNCMKIKGLG